MIVSLMPVILFHSKVVSAIYYVWLSCLVRMFLFPTLGSKQINIDLMPRGILISSSLKQEDFVSMLRHQMFGHSFSFLTSLGYSWKYVSPLNLSSAIFFLLPVKLYLVNL